MEIMILRNLKIINKVSKNLEGKVKRKKEKDGEKRKGK